MSLSTTTDEPAEGGKRTVEIASPRIATRNTHGTGCTYSAAITAHLAMGASLESAIVKGKSFIAEAIEQSYRTGAHQALNVWKGATT